MDSNVFPLRDSVEPLPALDDIVPRSELSVHAQRLIDYAERRAGRGVSRQTIVQQFNAVFEIIGGVPRLALWADENPAQFFAMYSKLLPQVAKLEHSMPPLDAERVKEMTIDELKLLVMRTIDVTPTHD